MARPLQNLILGALSFVPLLSLGVVVVYLYRRPSLAVALESAGNISPQLYSVPGWTLYVGAVLLVCGLVLYVYFVVRVIRTSEISTAGKVAWIIALSVAGPIAIPVAWWNVVRPTA